MMNEENQGNAPKRMSLKKKSSGTMTLQNAGGAKKVQVEVRKKKFNFDPKERKAQLEQELLLSKRLKKRQEKLKRLVRLKKLKKLKKHARLQQLKLRLTRRLRSC